VQVEQLTVAVVLMALPAVLFGTVAQKYLVEGLTSNSLK
jgi:ABC-type maltose transport system permease subunit